MSGNVTRVKEGRGEFKILTAKPTGKRHLGRPRRKCDENITTDLKEIDVSTRIWIDSVWIEIIGELL